MVYGLLLGFHILFIITWLGTDLAVIYMSFLMMNRRLSPEVRYQMGRVGGFLDLIPRVSALMTPTLGVTLAYMRWGLGDALGAAGIPVLVAAWVIGLGWTLFHLEVFRRVRGAVGTRGVDTGAATVAGIARWGDVILRGALLAGVVVFVAVALMGKSPFSGAWLDWKVILMGCIFIGSLSFRFTPGGDFTDALSRLRKEGSNDQTERAVRRSLVFAYPGLVMIHGSIIASIFLSTTKI